jgi:fructose-1,6-bisphosphatase/inositol monophosphatase family enzyme
VSAAAPNHRDLDVLRRVADAVADRLADIDEWSFSGTRDGQYAADVAVDEVAVNVLLDAGFAVLSEESGRSGDGDRVVVVDPLDGSTNASRGIPWFATSLCLVEDGGPSVALVANQATGERLEAVRGAGAWSGGRRLTTSSRTSLDAAVVGVSGLPGGDGAAPGWWQFRALGASALDLGLVASGGLDGWVDLSDHAHGCWDYLGALLLCSEAGGHVVDAFGRDLVVLDHAARRTPVAAATPELLAVLLDYRRST